MTPVAIVDYGMGNLFSVRQACEQAGLQAVFASSAKELSAASAVILPGVGAFGDAMDTLIKLDLVSALQEIANSTKPLIGICLGMQLMMTESHEFGRHRGLGIIEGEVVRLDVSTGIPTELKVPQIGWNQIFSENSNNDPSGAQLDDFPWKSPLLEGLPNGEYMYFIHSYYTKPVDSNVVISTSQYGDLEFCSTISHGSIFACQFHPERSGPAGLRIYQNLAKLIATIDGG